MRDKVEFTPAILMKSSLLTLLFAACGTLVLAQSAPTSSTPAPSQSPASQTTASQPSSAPGAGTGLKVRGPDAIAQAEPNRVVATIAGKQITAAQAADLLRPLGPEERKRYSSNLGALVQQLYMEQRLADEATQMKLDQQAPWKQQLDLARANILTQAYLTNAANNPTSTSPVPDVNGYYTSHVDDFTQCKVSGILVGFSPPGTPAANGAVSRTESDARAKADDLEKKIKGGGDLSALARAESDSPQSAAQGGDLGTFAVGDPKVPAPIKTAVAKLEPGQVSEPIRVPNGFYIIKLDSRTKQTLDQARPQILQKFQADKSQALIKQQMDKYAITVQDPDFFNASTGPKLPSLQRLAPAQSPAPAGASTSAPAPIPAPR